MAETFTQVHTFCGLVGHYWHFIKGFSHIMRPLYNVLGANAYSHKLLFAGFLISKLVLVLENGCERLHIEIFVRVLHSSRVKLNNVNDTNVFCCV